MSEAEELLRFELEFLLRSNPEGSHRTRRARAHSLRLMVTTIFERYSPMDWDSVEGPIIDYLIERWQSDEKASGRIGTRLSHLRWILGKIGKAGLVPEIPPSEEAVAPATVIDLRIQTLLDLARTSGMRFDEASLFRPHLDYDGKKVWIRKGTRGRKYRYVMVRNCDQGNTLRRAQKLTTQPDGCMIPGEFETFEKWEEYVSKVLRLSPGDDVRRTFIPLRQAYITHRLEHLTPKKGSDRASVLVAREVAHNRFEIRSSYAKYPLEDKSSHQSIDHGFVPGTPSKQTGGSHESDAHQSARTAGDLDPRGESRGFSLDPARSRLRHQGDRPDADEGLWPSEV